MTVAGGRKVNATGRATGRLRIPKRNKITGQFFARLIEMLESPAFRVLSQSAYRVLARLEIELGHHAGQDNGKLPVTFDDFANFGIDRHAIAPAIRECVALGFVEITQKGRAGNAEFRSPNLFRITYAYAAGPVPTHDWRKIETMEAANTLAKAARAPLPKTESQWGKAPRFSVGNLHRKAKAPSVGNPHYGSSAETPTTIYILGRDAKDT
jgi:hypothetical protein